MSKHFQVLENHSQASLGRAAFVCLLALLLCIFSAPAQAQILYGSLTGNVTDPTGAAVAGAHVEALDLATGVTQNTTTDASGIYRFSTLQEGDYKITIAQPS